MVSSSTRPDQAVHAMESDWRNLSQICNVTDFSLTFSNTSIDECLSQRRRRRQILAASGGSGRSLAAHRYINYGYLVKRHLISKHLRMNKTSTTSPSRTTSKRASSRSPWSRNYRASSRMSSKSLAAKMRPYAKTRATIGVGPVEAKAGKACDIYDIKKREALIVEMLRTTKPTTKSSGSTGTKARSQRHPQAQKHSYSSS